MLKVIIFDMDGLMVDTEMISFQCFQDLIRSYGFDFTKEEYMKSYPGRSLQTSLRYIRDHYQLDFDIQEKMQLFKDLEEKYINKDGVQLKKGLLPLLEYVKSHHYQTIIATSSHFDRAIKILGPYHIMPYIDNIVCGPEVQHSKPFPDIFLKACEKLAVHPHEALVLEDSEAGIQAAYDAHIPVICIPDMKYPHDDYIKKATRIYSSLEDVISYLENNS
ncbi:HAD family hydrolase [Candidatus Stoquefichus massiliensis]|uniref:HAD family hydrolase n=1 Tax=Candidatus Stoquefichus massiliensis TaxID=1470350 RepID=UPI00047F0CB9|nr:HAD family phosphatase [Candidatus Stoquefichus massiliensis]